MIVIDKNRALAQRLVALRLSRQSDQSELLRQMEPLMYRRLRDRAKRQMQPFDLNAYALSLDGMMLRDTFDAGLATSILHGKVDGLMRLIMTITPQIEPLDWAAAGLEDLINRRIRKTPYHVNVSVIKLSKKRLGRMSSGRRKKLEARYTLGFTTSTKEVTAVS